MRRRTAVHRAEQNAEEREEKVRLIRVRTEDVYGGMIPSRMQQDALLAQLAASIARHGLLQPIVVRRNAQAGRYALVCGARRLQACRMLNWQEIHALLIDADGSESAACFMEEHMTHKAVGVMEEAQMLDEDDFARAADALAFGRGAAERKRRLLALPEAVRERIREYGLTLEQAEPLLDVRDEARCMEAALIIAERSLTPAQARRLVYGPQQPAASGGGKRRAVRTALEEASASVRRMRLRGVEASLAVHSQERGMCIQILLQNGEKNEGRQEIEEKTRNI